MKQETLKLLEKELGKCSQCPLRKTARGPVGWFGNPDCPIVFVGEGPGGVEDDYGCPLIGPSGQLLDKALWAAKMTRDRVLTTNVIKCRTKGNRTPNIAEADFCAQHWLDKELEILQPKVVVALGGVALHYLGNPEMSITGSRGKWFKTKQGFNCIATFHPAYLLRLSNIKTLNAAKWDVFHDLEAARDKVLELQPEYRLMSEKQTNLFKLFSRRSQ